MVDKGETGASSTGKSLFEELHETGGGKEKWETACKSTERDAVFDQDFVWSEVFARNSVSLDYKSLCRDANGDPPPRHDSVRTPIGVNIEFVLCTSPRYTAVPRSEVALSIDTVLSSGVKPPTTPLSSEWAQKQGDTVRKPRSWEKQAATLKEKKKSSKVVRLKISHSPTKKDQ
jgi:hypothetical protein